MADSQRAPGAEPPASPLETTFDLLARVRSGDERARERLLARMLPPLRAWAHQRLPRRARDLAETDDLVQVTLVRVLRHLEDFEPRGEGALFAYLRAILMNAVRDEVRRTVRREPREPLTDDHVDPAPTALEHQVGRQAVESYEAALARLGEEQRQAVILKVEMGYSNAEIAEALGRPSADAARVFTARAIAQLAEAMREHA
jgi:RNA polymerase sigma-70 factor (ECF subfamily)